tara:strand:+ start:555 stop:1088 length:534 start_codon:yes stop_codon:yes gene_type:complete
MFIYKSNIDKEICKDIIKIFDQNDFKKPINTAHTNMNQLLLSSADPVLDKYISQLFEIKNTYVKKYKFIDEGQDPWELHERIKIQKYEPGESYFSWHAESTGYEGNNNRILVFSTFLNTIKRGGETEFFYQKEKIKAEEGRTILFPAFWTHTHRGNTTKETKYIITGWYTYLSKTPA